MMIDKDNQLVTVVVSSCDKYEEVWSPFFILFRKYWDDCKFDVVLNTESKQYTDYEVKTINAIGKWCERLNTVLDKIDTPYVLMCLEDFFLQGKVDSDEINRCTNIMNQKTNIACFYYKNIHCRKSEKTYYDKYLELQPTDDNNEYILNFQMGLWRKTVLQEILNIMSDKSPWEIEVNGFEPCKEVICSNRFFCSNRSYEYEMDNKDTFMYNGFVAIRHSKILWKAKKFLRKEGIVVKFKNMKTMSMAEFYYFEKLKPLIKRVGQYLIRKYIKIIGVIEHMANVK